MSERQQFGLSKSKITSFEQCPKRLWLQTHKREQAKPDPGAEARFAAGHLVGDIACRLCPGGTMIEAEPDLETALVTTREAIAAGQSPLFEATFEHDGVLVRVDIMEKDQSEGWHVAEVKSSTSRKSHHVSDLATQIWVMEGAGIEISDASIRHLNNQFVLVEENRYDGLFVDTPSLDDARNIADGRCAVVAEIRRVLEGAEPDLGPGDHCSDPFPCEYHDYCSQDLTPLRYPVASLPRTGKRLAAEWAEKGVLELEDVPAGAFANAVHQRIHEATLTGKPYHDIHSVRAAVSSWAFPHIYLDFETIGFPVPRWIGTKPWEQVPFQFSAHVEDTDGSLDHREFLSLDGRDPRRSCAEALISHISPTGAVITYNASFERSCISRLASIFPDLEAQLTSIASRIVDLLPVARDNWYHRDQHGSWSIKAVLPTISASGDYNSLAVSDGSAAQIAYLEAIAPGVTADRRAEIHQSLRDYCAKDTYAMVEVLRHLVG